MSRRVYTKADFPKPLSDYIEIDSEGYASFSYARRMGALMSITNHSRDLVSDALASRGKDREKVLKEALDYLSRATAETDLMFQMWEDHLDAHDRFCRADIPTQQLCGAGAAPAAAAEGEGR